MVGTEAVVVATISSVVVVPGTIVVETGDDGPVDVE